MDRTDRQLQSLGRRIRDRRRAMKMSIRALAGGADVSPSYLSAIETGRNATTGRPPEPSLMVMARLARQLEIPIAELASANEARGACAAHGHVLCYALGPRDGGLPEVRAMFDQHVDIWLYIADPRDDPATLPRAPNIIAWRWPFGAHPYPDKFLAPSRITAALGRETRRHRARLRDRRVGVMIADCSAVMKWVVNPESEIDFEPRWAEGAAAAIEAASGRTAAANVCVYRHQDILALAGRVDALDAILRLIGAHTSAVVSDVAGRIKTGRAALRSALDECRPAGISAATWRALTAAAAGGLAAGEQINIE